MGDPTSEQEMIEAQDNAKFQAWCWLGGFLGFLALIVVLYLVFVKKYGDSDKTNEPEDTSKPDLPTWRKILWPIYTHELTKFIPIAIMMICAIFVYTACRDIKDSMVTTENKDVGTIITQWLKCLGVLPASLASMALLGKLEHSIGFRKTTFVFLVTFGVYFVLNAFLIYPYRHSLGSDNIFNQMTSTNKKWWLARLHDNKDTGSTYARSFFMPFLFIFFYWHVCLHYILAELWGTIMISYVCWGYVNRVTAKSDAKRWYSFIGILGQIGQYMAGKMVSMLTTGFKEQVWEDGKVKATTNALAMPLKLLNVLILVGIILFGLSFAFAEYHVQEIPRFAVKNPAKKKKKVGLGAGLKYAWQNKHVLAIAGLVFTYGMVNVLVEFSYKDTMYLWVTHSSGPNAGEIDKAAQTNMKALESQFVAGVTILAMLCGGYVFQTFGWFTTALILPSTLAVLSAVFWGALFAFKGEDSITTGAKGRRSYVSDKNYFANDGSYWAKIFGAPNVLSVATWAGWVLAACMKAVKYGTFDPTKEYAFLTLPSSEKLVAKAAVDVVGARAGKSLGSLFNMLFQPLFHKAFLLGYKITTSILMVILLVCWIFCVKYLNNSIKQKEAEKAAEAIEDPVKKEEDDPETTVGRTDEEDPAQKSFADAVKNVDPKETDDEEPSREDTTQSGSGNQNARRKSE